jgi:hypothetical protein
VPGLAVRTNDPSPPVVVPRPEVESVMEAFDSGLPAPSFTVPLMEPDCEKPVSAANRKIKKVESFFQVVEELIIAVV